MANKATPMARRRGLLTDDEREQLQKEDKDNRHYQAVSRVRNKIQDELVEDVAILEDNHSGLLGELRAVVCEE